MSFRRLVVCAFFLFSTGAVFAQSSDIFVSKDAPSQATAGSNFTYTITVGNVGPDASDVVHLTDPLPAGLTFVSLTQSGPDTFVCSTPTVGTNGTVTCDATSMNPGDQQTILITVNVPGNAQDGTLYENIATVSCATDPTDENNSSAAGTSTPPPPEADVAITKSGPSSAAANSDVTYTITLTNLGPDDASNVSWSDTLPSGFPASPMTFVSFNQTSGPAFNCGNPGASVTCTLATMAAGATATFQYVGHIPNGTTSGTVYSNVASQTTSNDPNSENDSSATALTVSSADIGVTKTAPATGNAGGTIDYVITVTNSGPDPATNAVFNDTLANSETFVSVVKNSGPAANCFPPPAGPGGTVSCTIPILSNGASAQFTITVAISPSTPDGTVITNTATASSDAADSNSANNTSSASTTVSASADLAVTKSGPASVVAGTNVTYTINVTNNGLANALTVSLTDTIPAGATFVSFQQNSGPSFNCTTGATVNCSIATLTVGSSAAFTLTVNVGAGTPPGTLSNTATATSSTPDGNPGNNSSTASTTVTTSADLSVTKTTPPTPVAVGFDVDYTISVANNGPSDATGVSLTDVIPANMTFASLNQTTGPAFNCTTPAANSTGTITCTIGTFGNGATASFHLVLHNGATAGTTVTNTATISATTSDPNPANNSSSASVLVLAAIPALSASMLLLLAMSLGIAAWVALRRG